MGLSGRVWLCAHFVQGYAAILEHCCHRLEAALEQRRVQRLKDLARQRLREIRGGCNKGEGVVGSVEATSTKEMKEGWDEVR